MHRVMTLMISVSKVMKQVMEFFMNGNPDFLKSNRRCFVCLILDSDTLDIQQANMDHIECDMTLIISVSKMMTQVMESFMNGNEG